MGKICFIMNQAPRYVESSYLLFDKEFDIDWFFGKSNDGIKGMDLSLLKSVRILPGGRLSRIWWLKGALGLAFKRNYTNYIMIGEPYLLTTWVLSFLIKVFNTKAQILFWTHGWYGKESKFRTILKKIYFHLADDILLYGNYAKQLMIKEGFHSQKLHVIHNALHHKQQVELRNTIKPSSIMHEHFKNDYPTIVMIGRLNLRKKLDMLIDAVTRLCERGEYYNILFIGDGEDRESLEIMVAEKNITQQVWFYGASYDEEVNSMLLINSDLCVVPGDIGLTAIHALTLGVPTISHNCFMYQGPEFEAIKQDVTGDFFEHDNVNSLADTISNWFKNHRDRDITRQRCYKEIDEYWTPEFELNVLKQVLK